MKCRCACGCQTRLADLRRGAMSVSAETGGPRCGACDYAQHFDAPKRASDAVRLHFIGNKARAIYSWMAVRLSDGGTDNVLYDSKHEAVRHQLHEYQCAYIKIPPDGFSPRDAEIFLRFNRQLYDGGMRLADPDVDTEVIMPMRRELLH